MHASTEQLLTYRDDGVGSDALRLHLDGCERCTTRLDDLVELRDALVELPVLDPPENSWQCIAARLDAPAPRHHAAMTTGLGLAAAVLLAVLAVQLQRSPDPQPDTRLTATAEAGRSGTASSPVIDEVSPAPQALQAESRRLESVLRTYRTYQPVIKDPLMADAVRSIEAHVAAVDYGLTYAAEVPLDRMQADLLWQQRVDLMESLVQIRGAQLRRVEFNDGLR